MPTAELTYAGVPFCLDNPDILAWVERHLPLDNLRETLPPPPWPGRALAGLPLPRVPERPRLRLGDYYYPVGASRWSEFHGLATGTQMQRMRDAALAGGATRQTFRLRADPAGGGLDARSRGGIETQLYLLPPRPLALRAPGSPVGTDDLWLITLVDERYLFQWKPVTTTTNAAGDHAVPEYFLNDDETASATWAELMANLATSLGVTLTVPAIPSVYGVPWGLVESPLIKAYYQPAAVLLDACARHVGGAVVRHLDGTYELVRFADAAVAATLAANRGAVRLAGGAILNP